MDTSKAEEFKVRNKAAKREHDQKHDDTSHSTCGDHSRNYYIPESEMSFVDKTINSKICNAFFFKQNLVTILERAHQATTSISSKATQRGMELDSD